MNFNHKITLEINMSQATKDLLDALIAKITPGANQAEIDAINTQLKTDEAAEAATASDLAAVKADLATAKQDAQDLTDEVAKAITQLNAGNVSGATDTLTAATAPPAA